MLCYSVHVPGTCTRSTAPAHAGAAFACAVALRARASPASLCRLRASAASRLRRLRARTPPASLRRFRASTASAPACRLPAFAPPPLTGRAAASPCGCLAFARRASCPQPPSPGSAILRGVDRDLRRDPRPSASAASLPTLASRRRAVEGPMPSRVAEDERGTSR